ncbi:MAG TPA: biosynthetic peptidoglycan transglycosylase, partial [Polyangiaceae bacterium]|nr:biosynthetic peptidoglycan transglycosylase [Polyangiaceae bacterium]
MRSIAKSRAKDRGVELEIGGTAPGWFAVELQDCVVRLEGTRGIEARLESIAVHVTPWFSLSEIEVQGGELTLDGSLDELTERLRAWRAARPARESAAPKSGARLPLVGAGLALRWTGFDGTSSTQVVSGAYFERGEALRAGFERAQLELDGGAVDVVQAAAEFRDTPEGPALSSATVAQIVGRVSLSSALSATAVAVPATDDDLAMDDFDAADPAAASRPNDSHRWFAPLAAESWSRRREQLTALRRLAASRVADGAQVVFERVQLELTRGDSVLNVGPAPFRLQRSADLISAAFTPPAQKDGKQLAVKGSFPLEQGPIELSLEGGPISLETLGVHEGDFGLLGVGRSTLSLATRISLSTEGLLQVSARGQLRDLALSQPALAPEPVRDLDLGWAGEIALDLEQHRLEIKDGALSVARARVELGASLESNGEDLRVQLSLRVPQTPCQDMLEAAPRALLPQLYGLRLGGAFGLDVQVDFDTATPKEPHVEWNLHNDCQVLETPASVDPERFRQAFQHLVRDAKGNPSEITTGPSTELWVPLSDITPNMQTALVVCEDSRFFSHHGFDDKAIRDSIGDNLRAGHFVRGASTLSMQLAKNLYLGREKTLSRKLQEAVFTMLLEQRLTKEDILELYLNVVEFGPGIYGIRNAAIYYFNSHPGELSLAQALYLGSVLPSPKANHFQADGTLKRRWAEHLQYLMRVAHKI